MNNFHVDGDLLMANHAEFADVNLGRAHVGALSLQGSKVTGELNMNIIKVDGGLFMNNQAKFAEVDLTGAHVGGDLDLRGSKVTGKLIVNGLQVGSNLFMRDKAEFAEVDLTGAHVDGDVDLRGSKVAGDVNCYGLEVERQVFMGAKFDGRIYCDIAKIKGDLDLSYGQFKQDVDLSGTQIDGSLRLSTNDQRAQWADGVTLLLRDAKVLGTIPALTDAWAPKLDLEGFTYRSVGAADDYKDWFGRLDHYAPQPYDQLASTVQSQGNGAQATAIRYSSRERERSEAKDGAWVWLTILKWVIGYGYYPYLAVYWAIALVIMGALVLRVSGEGPRNGMPYGIAYSIDTLLPIIRLREKHSQIDLQSWPRYYFYGHRIMGYVLGFFLIAGITGLTK
jgi:cytoskeletal protein CcmA (bactofilin family)